MGQIWLQFFEHFKTMEPAKVIKQIWEYDENISEAKTEIGEWISAKSLQQQTNVYIINEMNLEKLVGWT